ncbi:MAG: hypothetical protein V1772_12545 [Chloroflexota bacterium]
MTRWVRTLFSVHVVVALLLGAALLVAPGRLLATLGWAPIDPILSRLLGAALLALGWGSWRGLHLRNPADARVLVEMDLAFCALGALGVLRHIAVARWPWTVWTLLVVLVAFAVAWGLARRKLA